MAGEEEEQEQGGEDGHGDGCGWKGGGGDSKGRDIVWGGDGCCAVGGLVFRERYKQKMWTFGERLGDISNTGIEGF